MEEGLRAYRLQKKLINKNFQIVIVDKNNFHQFQPLFYQVATSSLEPDSISFSLRKAFRKSKNVFFRMAEVLEVDSKNNTLKCDIGLIHYDYLVIATGTTNNYYGIDSVEKMGKRASAGSSSSYSTRKNIGEKLTITSK